MFWLYVLDLELPIQMAEIHTLITLPAATFAMFHCFGSRRFGLLQALEQFLVGGYERRIAWTGI
jgi:hypothetical protein